MKPPLRTVKLQCLTFASIAASAFKFFSPIWPSGNLRTKSTVPPSKSYNERDVVGQIFLSSIYGKLRIWTKMVVEKIGPPILSYIKTQVDYDE
jgi:hypothetical protein